MAEGRQDSGDLQRLVRTIVADLMSQEQKSLAVATPTRTATRFDSVDQEINNSFRIPRGGNSQENMPSTSGTNMVNNSQASTSIAMNFNSRQNYGRCQPQRKRQGARQPPTQPRKRINRMQASESNVKYIKDVCSKEGEKGIFTNEQFRG
jgi:hypothetical protein